MFLLSGNHLKNFSYFRYMKSLTLTLFLIFLKVVSSQSERIWIHPNLGQWDERIQYSCNLSGGKMIFDKVGLVYDFYLNNRSHSHGVHSHAQSEHKEGNDGHVIFQRYLNRSGSIQFRASDSSEHYSNYFLGNDRSKWVKGLKDVGVLDADEIYPNISLNWKAGEELKSTWKIKKGGDLGLIEWVYEGASNIEISKNGSLKIGHSFGYFTESKPVAWLIKNGVRKDVNIQYRKVGNKIGFQLLEQLVDFDELIIDPTLVFSTFTGAGSDNWGFTATPAKDGGLVAGGIVFGVMYPLTPGAYQTNYRGGDANPNPGSNARIDLGLTYFDKTGKNLIFSTYLGGTGNETVHSVIMDKDGSVYGMGVTSSRDLPVSNAAFQKTHSGGISTEIDGIYFNQGIDIFIFNISGDGKQLNHLTYLGGNENDGVNITSLNYNYGDFFRGDLNLDNNGVFIGSTVRSQNFPFTSGALKGSTDALIASLKKDLSGINWAVPVGGTNFECGNGITLDGQNHIFLTGGTTSSDFGSTGYDTQYSGVSEGFIVRLNSLTGAVQQKTFIGESGLDQTYFVQVDAADNVYVLGISDNAKPASAGKYTNPNSGQFIYKLTNDLSSLIWNTCVGGGSGETELSPSAFLVSDCDEIFLAGWGGRVNADNSQNTRSSTENMPITFDAFQTTTNGSSFWIGVLAKDATILRYGTYMGGSSVSQSDAHVDGGTSRFDKSGGIYHAVCGACGGLKNGFTTTPGVWSTTNKSANCNLAAFKFALNKIDVKAQTLDTAICINEKIKFKNTSANGKTYLWNFGDGATSTEFEPVHTYKSSGTFTVKLVVKNDESCTAPDSIIISVKVKNQQVYALPTTKSVCTGDTVHFSAGGGNTYSWFPRVDLSSTTIPNPVATVNENRTYYCVINGDCGTDTLPVQVSVAGGSATVSPDVTICLGNSTQLSVSGVNNPTWTPTTFLDNPTSSTPVCTAQATTEYTVTGLTDKGCSVSGSVKVTVQFGAPVSELQDSLKYCPNTAGSVTVSGGDAYLWSPASFISSTTANTVVISSPTPRYYYVAVTNLCETVLDSVYVDLFDPQITVDAPTIVCPNDTASVYAFGAVQYFWTPSVNAVTPNFDHVIVKTPEPVRYYVRGIDKNNCEDTTSFFLQLYPTPTVRIDFERDIYGQYDTVVLTAVGTPNGGSYQWSPENYVDCSSCQSVTALAKETIFLTVNYTDESGCKAKTKAKLIFGSKLYVPNVFTPDNDQYNERFFAKGADINSFEMIIFDRWGEVVFTSKSMDESWDGTFNGVDCKEGVYTWKIIYSDFQNSKNELVGHVTLLR